MLVKIKSLVSKQAHLVFAFVLAMSAIAPVLNTGLANAAGATVHKISSCAALQNIPNLGTNSDTYKLTQNIDCSGVENFEPISFDDGFTGIFDGQGHTITNLVIEYPDDNDVGLFSLVDGAVIKNTRIEDAIIAGDSNVGGFLGLGDDTLLSNLSIEATINAAFGGGSIAGHVEFDGSAREVTSISQLHSSGEVICNDWCGGLLGAIQVYGKEDQVMDITLERSHSTSLVDVSGEGAGGLVGWLYVENDNGSDMPDASITVKNSYSTGNASASSYAGGITAWADAYNDDNGNTAAVITIDRSYSSGDAEVVDNYAGGIIGYIEDLDYEGEEINITNTFNTGLVAGDSANFAVVGGSSYIDAGELSFDNVYFDQTTTNQSYPTYDEITGWTAVNSGGEDGDYFKDNSTNPPLDEWDFETVWQTKVDDFPVLSIPAIIVSAENGKQISIEQSGCGAVENTTSTKESNLTSQDPAYSYPMGMVGFNFTDCTIGGTATVIITFTGTFDSDILVRKYNPDNNSFTTLTNVTKSTTTLDGQPALKAVYSITDGGELDQDGAANGTIVDPVGLASAAISAPNTGLGGQ